MDSKREYVWYLAKSKTGDRIVHFVFADSIDSVREYLLDAKSKYIVRELRWSDVVKFAGFSSLFLAKSRVFVGRSMYVSGNDCTVMIEVV